MLLPAYAELKVRESKLLAGGGTRLAKRAKNGPTGFFRKM
jgi:hypothetical protein